MEENETVDEETRRKLRKMNLGELVEAIDVQEQQNGISTVPFCDSFKMLDDYSYQEKYNKKVEWLLISASGYQRDIFRRVRHRQRSVF